MADLDDLRARVEAGFEQAEADWDDALDELVRRCRITSELLDEWAVKHGELRAEKEQLEAKNHRLREVLKACEHILPIRYKHAPPGSSGAVWNEYRQALKERASE